MQKFSLFVPLFGLLTCCAGASDNPTPYQRPVLINATTRNETEVAGVNLVGLPLVLAPDASERLKTVAADVARVLEKMTGQKPEIKVGDGKSGLVLGTLAQFSTPGLEKALEIRGFDGVESYAIRTSPGRVLILGAHELGAQNGAYRLLKELGCRWFMPGPEWEVIPTEKAPVWKKNITDRPEILSRRVWYLTNYAFDNHQYPSGNSPGSELALWRLRNAQNESFRANAGEYWSAFYAGHKEEFAAHPEWWPLIDGERKANKFAQFDIGHKDLRDLMVEDVLLRFRRSPEADMMNIGPNDSHAWSQSPEFKALGSVSDAVFTFANEAARAVQKEFPGKMVGLYAYNEWALPPKFALEPNVHIQITPALSSSIPRDEIIRRWTEKTRNIGYYDYYAPFAFFNERLPGPAMAQIRAFLKPRITLEASQGATSIAGEASGSWAILGLPFYVASALMWNTATDLDALETDFYDKAFGPASAPMRRFFALKDADKAPLVSKNLLYEMALELQKATVAAKNRPEILARLALWKHYLRFVQLDWTLAELPRSAPYEDRERAFVDLWKHIYKIRYAHVIHYALASQMLFKDCLKYLTVIGDDKKPKLGNPDVAMWVSAPKNPWKDDTFYTPAEIEANFASTLEFLKSPLVEEKSFSTDLVPIEWQGAQARGISPADAVTSLKVQSGVIRLALYSFGEALPVTVLPDKHRGAIAPRPWKLTDKDDKTVAEGAVAPDDAVEKKTLSIAVPRAGNYFFEVADRAAGFVAARVGAEVPASIVLRRGRGYGAAPGNSPRLFYVPRGTKTVFYLFGNLSQPGEKVTAPDGKIAFETRAIGRDWTTVEVPPGMDGKVWRLDTATLGKLWLGNVPPYVAASADRLLVPREVAQNDGLTIRTK